MLIKYIEEFINSMIRSLTGNCLIFGIKVWSSLYFIEKTRSPQGLYNWAACDVTNPNLSPLLSLTFQVISGTSQIFR